MSQLPSEMTASQWAASCGVVRQVGHALADVHEDMEVSVGNVVYFRDETGQKFSVTVEPLEG